MEEKQLHTRIQFLQNQEFKKLKKIENQRRQAQAIFENKIEKHKVNLEIEKNKGMEA